MLERTDTHALYGFGIKFSDNTICTSMDSFGRRCLGRAKGPQDISRLMEEKNLTKAWEEFCFVEMVRDVATDDPGKENRFR